VPLPSPCFALPCRSRHAGLRELPRHTSSLLPASAVPLLTGCGSAWQPRSKLGMTMPTSASSRWGERSGGLHRGAACPPARCPPMVVVACMLISLCCSVCARHPGPSHPGTPCPGPTTADRRACSSRGTAPCCASGPAHPAPQSARRAAAPAAPARHVQQVRPEDRAGEAGGVRVWC